MVENSLEDSAAEDQRGILLHDTSWHAEFYQLVQISGAPCVPRTVYEAEGRDVCVPLVTYNHAVSRSSGRHPPAHIISMQ